MYPYSFPGSREIKKPEGMTDEECGSMPARQQFYTDGTSYWIIAFMPSYEDRMAINAGRNIFLRIIAEYAAASYTMSEKIYHPTTGETQVGNEIPLAYDSFIQMNFKPTEETIKDVNRDEPVYFTIIGKYLPVTNCFTCDEKGNINE